MTSIYDQFRKDDKEKNVLELAPSQNIKEDKTPAFNQYDEFRKQDREAVKNQVKANLQLVMDKDPDMVGEGLKLAEELNLPKEFALNSNEAVSLMMEKNRKDKLKRLQTAQYSPVLYKQLSDPTFAALAYDNIDNLEGLEKLFNDFKNIPENASQGWEKGRLNVRRGKIGILKKGGNTDPELDIELANINNRLQELEADGTGMFEEAGSIFGQYSKTLPNALEFGLATGTAAGVAGAVTGPGSIFTAKGGFLVGFLGSMAFDSYAIEGGSMYLDLVEEGMDDQTAKNIATGVGLVNAGIEFIGLGYVTAPIRKALIKETTKQISKELLKPTVSNSILKFAKNYFLNNMLAESLTEVGQEFTNVLGRDLSVALSDKEDLQIKITTEEGQKEIAQRLATTFIRTVQGMSLVGLVGSGPVFLGDIQKVKKAKENEIFLNELSKDSSTSVLKKRSAKQYKNLTQNLGNENGKPNVYVDAQAITEAMLQQGLNIEDIEQVSPTVANQLKELSKAGTLIGNDVVIPTGEYAAQLANTEFDGFLKQHIRWDKNDFSKTESTYFEANREQLYEEARAISEKAENKNNEFTNSAAKVKKEFKAMLLETGKFYKENAEYAASFYRDFVITQSNKLGILPDAFDQTYPYKVFSTDQIQVTPEQQLFNQDGTAKIDTPQFKEFFGKSVLQKNGVPEVLYHGTKDSFSEFNLDHPNKKDFGFLGKGVYMSRGEKGAKGAQANTINKRGDAGANIIPLYVRLENPYYATQKEKRDNQLGGEKAAKGFQDRLIEAGHDGVILKGSGGIDEVVVFDNTAVKSTFNSGTWSRETADILKQQELLEDEVFAQRAKPQKKGKVIPDNILEFGKISNSFDFAGQKQYATNRDFKIALQERINNAAKEANVDLSEFSIETEKHLIKNLLADAGFALETNPNAVGWYNEKVTKALNILSLVHPEIATNPQAKFAFTWALANTSNGLKVDKNFELAEQAYAFYAENGVMPTNIGIGDASAAINNNMKLFNRLMEEKGFEEFEGFMKTMHTVKDVEAFTGSTVSGENKTEMVYGAAVMGPKIGNGFFANLYGQFEQLTMDRWLMRTWGRMTGTLITDYKKQAKIKRNQLKPLIKGLSLKDKKAFEKIIGIKIKLSNLDEIAIAIQKASMKPANRKAMAKIATIEDTKNAELITQILGEPKKNIERIGIGDELRKGGNGLAKFIDGQKEAPSGPVERRQIRKVFNEALKVLQQDEKSLTMADLQALVWYPEKRLYDSAKLNEAEQTTGYQDNEAPDYANAAVNLAQQLGVSDADIQTTLQEVDLELKRQAIERTRRSESGEGTGGVVQRDNIETDEGTGLPINPDGTVTVYHHTSKRAADAIRKSGELRSAGEPDVYVTTRRITDTGYGDTAVALRVEPSRLSLDDEFPNGRRDFRLNVGKPRGSIRVKVGEFAQDLAQQSKLFSQQQVPSSFDDARGGFDPKTLTAFLNTKADISTFFHETAHFMLTVTEDLVLSGQATPEIQNDFDILLDFWGVDSVDTWSKLSLNEKRKYHEAFAYNFEIYLTETKPAPSVDLQKIFIKFADYVRRVYKSIVEDLNKIYKEENGVDLPVLTDEVRGVMDRMIASENEIKQSQQIYALKPMFETQEESGMSDAMWKEYTDAIQETQDAAIDSLTKASMKQVQWLSDAKSKVLKELQKKVRATRKKVMAEETVKAENEPLYKLQKFLKTGEWSNEKNEKFKSAENNKIDIKSLKNLVPFYDMASEIKKLGTGKYGMVSQNGIPVQMVAEMFGFETATGMINGLIDLEPIKNVIKERTDQRMVDEFSGLTDPKQQELQVQEALHNEARAKFLAIELKFLTKTMQPVRYQIAAAKQVARDVLARKPIKEIRPNVYVLAEKRAIKEAQKAMRMGEDTKVIEAKRSEFINSALAREAVEVRKNFEKSVKEFKKFFKDSDKKVGEKGTRNVDYISAGQEILSRFGLGPKLEEGRTFVDKLKTYNKDLYNQLSDIIDEAKLLRGKTLKELTLRDFETLNEIMQSLWYQSLRDQQFKTGNKLVSLQSIKDELLPLLEEQDDRLSIEVGKKKEASFIQQRILELEGLKAKINRVEHFFERLDGSAKSPRILRGDGKLGGGVFTTKEGDVAGPFTRYLWRTLKDPLVQWRSERPKYTGRYLEMLKDIDFGTDKIKSPELDYTFGDRRGRGKTELLGAMLHTGNLSNLTKLLVGRGWGNLREDGSLDTTRWDAFVQRMIDEGHLTAKDYKFLQDVWDMNEELLPLIQQTHRDVFGYYFKEIGATPIINKFGTFRGGYVAAKPDLVVETDIPLDMTLNMLREEMRLSVPSVPRGFTKPRSEQVNRALSISLFDQAKHIDDALRFAYVQPAVTDLLRIFNDKQFKKELTRIDRFAYKNMLIPWLENAASQKTSIRKGGPIDNMLTALTKSVSLNYMFNSFKNATQQVTGVLPAMLSVEKKYMTDAFRRYLRDPKKTMDEVAEMSSFMRDRQINQMFDIQDTLNDLILNPTRYERVQNFARRHGYYLQQAFQNFVDSLVWIATWNQVTANAPKTMSVQEIQVEAIAQADANVRKTQDSLLPEDVAAYQISSPFVKMIVQFTSYFNTQANLNATQYKKVVKELGFKSNKFSGQIFYAFMFGTFLPALVSEGIQELFGGGLVDEDEDGYLDEILEFVLFSTGRYASAYIPTGSTFLMMPFNLFDDKPYNDRITISPSISLINSTLQGTQRFIINALDPDKDIRGNDIRSVITLLGLIGNVPVYFAAKPIGLLVDFVNGKWVPRGPIDFVRGLVSGQRGQGRN